MSSFNIAVVQPHTNPPPDDAKNVDDAVKWIERAAGEGSEFVCFPESYPGPWRMPASYDPSARIAEAAHKFGIHVVFGTMEPIDDAKRTAYNLTCMAYPDGRRPARYRRTHPKGPWIYSSRTGGGGVWEFEWVPGDAFPVFDTVHGKVGLGMCSEVYMPEVSRAFGVARGGDHLSPGWPKRRRESMGDLAHPAAGAGDREFGAGCLDPEHLRSGDGARAGDHRRSGADALREH
jgi:predicted amidohydrolase